MRQILLLAGFTLLILSFKQDAGGSEVIATLKQANTDGFCGYLDTAIDLKLPGKAEVKNVGKPQASATLKNFFIQNKIHGFQLKSQREMGDIMYAAGQLTGAKAYNITVMMKDNGSGHVVLTVRIN